ncbi:hypothetical protein MAPG_07825 [Magnaporthiopsis poae ATCC 64411]|uniref:Uncharacterized protein n=1 Tax=Magnaporthiopsis poae (strain ATCC 64411 / 73-15) TaxID=644358 RepID=A0A0C4E5Q1_MAGP6|nr:hypothetical protein MAPG_07825 [Magnaporthiopsis poae ATCC 64411]
MHFSSASLTALAALLVAPSAASPNGWSQTKNAPDGPNKLYECGCKPIIDAMVRCQTRKSPSDAVRQCVCIKNPDGWYTSMNGCRDCLGNNSPSDGFFDNLAGTITQLFVSCTNTGGSVTSRDGASICAGNSAFERCAGLKTGGKEASWASIKVFSKPAESSNGTYVVDIPGDPASSSTTTTSGAAAAATNTGAANRTASGTAGTNTAPGTQTTSSSSSTPGTTAPSSAMGYAGFRSHVGGIVGLAVAVGAVALLV